MNSEPCVKTIYFHQFLCLFLSQVDYELLEEKALSQMFYHCFICYMGSTLEQSQHMLSGFPM